MSDTPVAIVTGAGSGIGRATAEVLAGAGYRLALVGRRDGTLEETMNAIAARSIASQEMLSIPADVGDEHQARSVVDVTFEQWQRVDALVNNAGFAPLANIADTDVDLVYRTFAVNTFGPAHLIARAWPIFTRQGGGCIVNVSSRATSDPFPGFFVYAATKSALESFTRSAAQEGAAHGIRAYSVAPGAVETAALRGLFSEQALPREAALDPLDVARVIGECVLGRRPEPSGSVIPMAKRF